ncbi:TadE/TadG family type IV pilus assembly protein [Isoptericola jiangsuensis]|uniref:TadE/TadG family type IV pilus assembly protein n=1 Tax=Isoptericola jiangsuensis TaxID=548579 RepID=UPI003AAA8688
MARALRTPREDRREVGQAAIELAGAVFLLLLVTVLAIQGVLIAQGASVAQEAARNGARALSQERDWRQAARDSVPDGWDIARLDASTGGDRARVETVLSFPLGIAGIHITNMRITRDAEFPLGS